MLPGAPSDDAVQPSHPGSGLAVTESLETPLAATREEEKPAGELLPRRDYVILPLLSLLTIIVLFAAAEVIARKTWSAAEKGYCTDQDPIAGPHGRPNCTAMMKVPESQWVTETYNNCGYRTPAPCGPKPPGTERIAVLGSSIAEGYLVPIQDTFPARAAKALAEACRHPVEFQNLGAEGAAPIYSYRRLEEALALKPDIVIMAINPWDVEQQIDPKLMAMRGDRRSIDHAPTLIIRLSFLQRLQARFRDSRTLLVAQHYILQNRDVFLNLYLHGGDHTAFVKVPFTPAWEKRFLDVDVLLREMAAKIHGAGLPFLLLGVPERAQVAMLNAPNLPAGVDPDAFGRRLAQMAARYGILYVDGLKALAHVHDVESLFFVVDRHPT
ncbi:MAG: SGNH/GDSL hydrolase family protein, partial [Acidobacteriaceae bacterium]|nr:SGNH/GDSL hydrolase family protein [Acidobacteriaceae bacterium]